MAHSQLTYEMTSKLILDVKNKTSVNRRNRHSKSLTSHLTASTPGSAPYPILGKKYGRSLPCLTLSTAPLKIFKRQTGAAKNQDTLNTMCMSSLRPSLPGYLPAMLVAVRSNRLAPVSAQMAWTNIFFPVPRGPANRTDRIRGPFT